MTAALRCPLCGWTQVSEVDRATTPDNLAAAPGVARALGVPTNSQLSINAFLARRRDERALERHLSTHGPEDWLPALTAALAATHHLELATTSAAERTKVIDQAARIAQMGGVDDATLTALLHLAAAKRVTPTVERRLLNCGIEIVCRHVTDARERIAATEGGEVLLEILTALDGASPTVDEVRAVTRAGEALPPRGTTTCDGCGRERTADDVDYNPAQVVHQQLPGWYSGDDGEICPQCMAQLMNGGAS